jgi:hypothetical protein
MRGVPNPHNDQPSFPSLDVVQPGTFIPRNPSPRTWLAALGREVLELLPRKQRGSLEAYRQAANDLSRILKKTGVRVKPKVLYYTALRVTWLQDQVAE